jgi:hypothetical protein
MATTVSTADHDGNVFLPEDFRLVILSGVLLARAQQ